MSYFPSLAFLTEQIGTGEWFVLFVVILIVIGPKRMPEVARKIGRMMEMFRRAADEFKDQLMTMDQEQTSTPPAAETKNLPESSDNPYPDSSGYPGNEDHVENWSSDSLSENLAHDAPAADTAPAPQPAPEKEAAPEKTPSEGAA